MLRKLESPFVCKISGFGDDPASSIEHGWIDTFLNSNDPDFVSRVFCFFASNSALMCSIFAADQLGLVRFTFSDERLPEWACFMLVNAKDSRVLGELYSLFRGVKRGNERNNEYSLHLWLLYTYLCAFVPANDVDTH